YDGHGSLDDGIRHAVPNWRHRTDEDRRRGRIVQNANRFRQWRIGRASIRNSMTEQGPRAHKLTMTWRRNRMTKIMRLALSAIAAFALAGLATSAPAAAQAPTKVTIVVFGFPSLGAFMPPVIKALKLDTAHGLDIEFVERPPDAYTTQFNSGEFKVGGSAAVLTVGLAD